MEKIYTKCVEIKDEKVEENIVYAFIDNKLLSLKKLKDTRTNENRKDIRNKETAVYIADKLLIHNIIENNSFNHIITYNNKNYKIKDIIENNYSEELNIGIEYYLTDKIFKKNNNEKITYYKNGQIKDKIIYTYKKLDIFKTHARYYENGIIKFIKYYRNNLLIDNVKEYYDDGNIMLSEEYYNNNLHGTCYYFYKNKNLKSELNYYGGKLHGEQKYYYENGNLFVKTFFLNGTREGQTKIFYENGNIKSDGFYLNNKRIGIFFNYDENGVRQVIEINKKKNKNVKYKFIKYPCKKSITWTINFKQNEYSEIKENLDNDFIFININNKGDIETEVIKNIDNKDYTCKHDIENEIDYFEKIYSSNYYKISDLEDIQEEDEFINEKEILEELNIDCESSNFNDDIQEIVNSILDQILNE